MFAGAFLFAELVLQQRPEEAALLEKVRAFGKVRRAEVEKMHAKEGRFMALTHGDAWANNFMFKFVTMLNPLTGIALNAGIIGLLTRGRLRARLCWTSNCAGGPGPLLTWLTAWGPV